MQEWIDYPPSEIERDEREAAKVGAAGLQAYLQGLEGAAKKPEADDLVNVVSLAVRTDGPGAQEIVMAALDLLQGFEWFAVIDSVLGYDIAADDIAAARARPLPSLDEWEPADKDWIAATRKRMHQQKRIEAAFDAAEAAGNDARKRWKHVRSRYENLLDDAHREYRQRSQVEDFARLARQPAGHQGARPHSHGRRRRARRRRRA